MTAAGPKVGVSEPMVPPQRSAWSCGHAVVIADQVMLVTHAVPVQCRITGRNTSDDVPVQFAAQ